MKRIEIDGTRKRNRTQKGKKKSDIKGERDWRRRIWDKRLWERETPSFKGLGPSLEEEGKKGNRRDGQIDRNHQK